MMLSCKETARLLSESMVKRPPFAKRLALRMHLMMCRLCRRNARQIEAMQEAYRKLSDRAPLGDLSPESRDSIKAALRRDS